MPLSARDAYRDELTRLAHGDPDIVCLEADLGGMSHPFAAEHPDRFMNTGVAESATIDMATGLAVAGLKPFVSTFAPFAALRSAESVKLGLGYIGAPVTIVAPYGGVSGAWFGTTHHSLEDLALVQAIPGVRIAAPYGEEETRALIREAARGGSPFYIRLGRNAVHESLPGADGAEGLVWEEGDPGGPCLVSVGESGTELCRLMRERRPDIAHVHLLYLDGAALTDAAPRLGERSPLVVVEEHRAAGGVASALALLLPDHHVYGHNCGVGWPSHGGDHEAVLGELGFDLDRLEGLVEQVTAAGRAASASDGRVHGVDRKAV